MTSLRQLLDLALARLAEVGAEPRDDEETRLEKALLNTASRMESQGTPDRIQITRATYELIKNEFDCEYRGTVPVKGKGGMECWYLISRRDLAIEPAEARPSRAAGQVARRGGATVSE